MDHNRGMVTIDVTQDVAALYEALGDVACQAWAECGIDGEPLAIDWPAWAAFAASGVAFAVVASSESGEAIGYAIVSVCRHPMMRGVLVASGHALYVRPSQRGGSVGAAIMREAQGEAARRGAGLMMWHCRAGTGLADKLLRAGYERGDDVVMMRLGDRHGH